MATEPLPCPFCGHVGVSVNTTSTYRWAAATCNGCGVVGPEIRRRPDNWEELAVKEWNQRVPDNK